MVDTPAAPAQPQSTVIPGADSLIGDLLDMDLGGPTPFQQQQMMSQVNPTPAPPVVDLLGEGMDGLVSGFIIYLLQLLNQIFFSTLLFIFILYYLYDF